MSWDRGCLQGDFSASFLHLVYADLEWVGKASFSAALPSVAEAAQAYPTISGGIGDEDFVEKKETVTHNIPT